MTINALIAQGGTPIGADVPQILNMLQQRAQQTLQNNRLSTQDQYAAEQHQQQTEQYNQGKEDNDAKQAYGESSQLLQIQEPQQFLAAVQQAPHILTALQQHNIDPSNPDAVRQAIQNVNHMTAAHLGIGPPKPVEISAGAKLFAPPDASNPNAGYRELASNVKPDEITAYQKESLALTRRGQDMTNAREKASGNKLPSGYELDPNKIGALRPIAGGPADPSRVKNAGTIADRMNPTMLASVKLDIAETRNALDKIKGLTTDTAGAFFSVEHAGPLASLFHRAATPEQMQNYDAYANRLAVAIASMQSMGRGQISDAKVSEARKLVPAPGDKKSTIGVKLGQIRRIADLAEQTLTQSGSSQTNPIADAVDETGGDTSGLRAPAGAPAPQGGLPPDIAALVKKHGG